MNSENSVSGSDYVGGAIGSYVKGSTSNVTVSLKSLGSVTGANYVGGAIGRVAGGSITSVASDVYANSAIGGGAYIGGTVGTVDGGTITTASLVLHGVYYPVAQKSGSNPGEACIGGVIGRINNGTVTNAKLSGEGGSIDLSSNFGKTYSNAMLINANGSSLGGVIGQVVAGSSSKIYNIEVDSVNICVVSSDGSDNIGGWIGSCYGQIGQSGTVFNVNSVKLVYSSGNNVGGFCGSFGSGSSNSDTLYSSLSVVLDGAYITGRSGVGGIFGRIDGAKLETGNANRIEVKLTNETRVGDFRGTVGGSLEGCICYNAGGAIGCYTAITTISGNNSGSNRLWVEIDPTSMVFAGADSGHPETDGVGGAIGIFGTAGNNNSPSYGLNSINEECDAYISVYCESPEPSVYSGFTNAGGVFGFMAGGKVRYCFSTAVVRSDGISEGIGTGGFIGKMDAGTIYGSYSGGHTNTDNMYSEDSPNVIGLNNVGGLIGLMGQNVTSVQDCYSTSSVSGLNYVGGFIGHIVEENKNANVVKSTYSTGSVFGSEPDPEAGVYIGAFVGFAPDDRNGDGKLIFFEHSSSNKYVAFTNPTSMPIVGNIESVERAAIFGAFWTGDGNNWYGTNYIRVNPLSTYNAYPFNENLKSAVDAYFPLRTYVSYFTGEEMVYEGDNIKYKIYYGIHYGDWPMPYDGFGKKAISSCAEAVINGSYTYDPSNPTAIDPTNDLVLTSTVEQNTTLVLGVDYEVTGIRNNTNAGTANIVLNGIGDYFGTLTVDFQIAPANLEDLDVDVVVGPETTPGTDGSLVPGYAVRLFFSNDTIKDLVKDTDYEAALYDADDGSHVIKISGKGNYTGEIIVPYCIVSFESDADNKVYSVVRSGEYVTPPDVSKEGSTLLYWYYLNASNEETEFDLSAPVTSDAELFAKWEEDNPGDNPGDGSGEGSGEGAGDAGGNTYGNTDGNTTEGDAASGDTNGGDTTGGNAATGDQNDMTTPPAVTGDDTSNDSDDDSGSGEGGGEQGGDTGSGEGGTSTDQQTGGEQGGDSSSSRTDGINVGDYD